MDDKSEAFYDLQEDECARNTWKGQAVVMKRWIRQPSFIFICALFTLCILLLFIIIILVVIASHKDQKEINTSLEKIMSAIIREGSLESDIQMVLSEVVKLSDTLKNREGTGNQDGVCSPKWSHHGQSCYYVSRQFKSWSAAKKHCEELKAHLVVINSEEEQQEMNSLTRGLATWIGLTDVDGEWKWVDGTSYNSTPKFWNDGQPDDWYGHGLGGGEDCGQIHFGEAWNDDHCSRKFQYICEKKNP